ncbi:MAG: ABC transporter ATP-binding protein [Caldilinea sp.]|nr:ABC transporter ATP-binding protein [Caldilinea sp.]MCB9116503.1 ABC transporter ATP-binding protein [Caldilineaceae bacterium]MCB9140728.1 ABC transporter ATP-binding protein [Anaerolineales bacterium]MCO5209342.1 ABC transporter ATP-binding protein [Caldilinea sp.]MCW5844502.1 ABC transporter ATP-binding protein [Caldilinea sp.]
MPAILSAEQITKSYVIGDRQIAVLDDVSFDVQPGEFVVIMGSSGSGKSTLLSVLSGLDQPSRGRIRIDGVDVTDWSEDRLAPIRNSTFGFVFQSFHLVPSLNALENVAFPAELRGDKDARTRARTLLERVGLGGRTTNFPHQLSGGEKQRVAICRALVNDPKIIFADEPTGNLDSKNGAGIIDLLIQLHRERQTTLVLVTHAPEVAEHAGRVITLADGKVVGDEYREENANGQRSTVN